MPETSYIFMSRKRHFLLGAGRVLDLTAAVPLTEVYGPLCNSSDALARDWHSIGEDIFAVFQAASDASDEQQPWLFHPNEVK